MPKGYLVHPRETQALTGEHAFRFQMASIRWSPPASGLSSVAGSPLLLTWVGAPAGSWPVHFLVLTLLPHWWYLHHSSFQESFKATDPF